MIGMVGVSAARLGALNAASETSAVAMSSFFMGSSRIGALTRSMINLAAQALSRADIACVGRRNQALSEKKFYIYYILEFLICFHSSKQR
jgi:hypothetical protein